MLGVEPEPKELDEVKIARLLKIDKKHMKAVDEVIQRYGVSYKDLDNSLMTGFDIASNSGPLFEEPILGAIIIIESIELK